MAVITLRPSDSVALPSNGTAALSWQVGGALPANVAITFERLDAPGTPAPAAQSTGEGAWLVPALPVATQVVVRPRGLEVFPDGALLHAQLQLRLGASASDEYVLPDTDIGGTSEAVVLRLIPHPTTWQLEIPVGRTVSSLPSATPSSSQPGVPPGAASLPALTNSTIYRCRTLLGGAGQLPAELRRTMQVAVDRSASMLPYVRSGARQSLLEILLGVNEVIGTTHELPVWQLGTVAQPASLPLSGSTVIGYDAVLGDVPRTTGTVLAPLVRATTSSEPSLVVVLTDGVPADLDDLDAALTAASGAGGRTRWHLLTIARSTSDPQVAFEPWRDELTGLRELARHQALTYSSVTPGQGDGWLAARLAAEVEVATIISGLNVLGTPG